MKILLPILIGLLFLFGNSYVFYRIWQAIPPNLIGRIVLIVFATFVISSFVLSFVAVDSLPLGLATFIYKVGTAWLFILLYIFIIFLLQDLLGLANKLLHFMPSDALTRYTRDSWVGLTFVLGFVALFMFCGFLKYRWKVRVPVAISLSKPIGDSTKNTIRAVAISDLHLGYGIGKSEFESWIETINSENPDIVLIAGDIIDSSISSLLETNCAESFKKIQAPLGVYACLGNHEYISNIDSSLLFLKQTGINLLIDSTALVDNRFYIVGRDDKWNQKRKPLSALLDSLDKSKPIIVLDHQPYHLEEAEKEKVDIQFSGHTHSGQVWPISMITKRLYELDHGYKKKDRTNIVVSSGIGIWGGKFRIGTQSEYVVIDIEGKK